MSNPDKLRGNSSTPPEAPNPEWSMLVYLAGDNNLTSEMVWGLQELKKKSAELKVVDQGIDIVAHFDPGGLRSRRYDIARSNGTTKPQVIAPTQDGNLDATIVHTQSSVDAANKKQEDLSPALDKLGEPGKALSAFVMSQLDQLQDPKSGKTKRFLVVLSGHGSGAEGDFLIDTDPKTSLSIPELGVILSEARRVHYLRRTKKTDWKDTNAGRIAVLGMDSCLMSNVEVCYEIRDSVDFLVASEGFVENTGWPYHRVVEALAANASSATEVVSKQIAERYRDFYRDYEVAGVSTDISVCNLHAFRDDDGLGARLAKLAKVLIPKLEACYARQLVELAIAYEDKGKAAITELAQEIAKKLDNPDLVGSLDKGSESAKQILIDGTLPKGLEEIGKKPAPAALLELKQTLNGDYAHSEEPLSKTLAEHLWRLPSSVDEPEIALALVRALRELDPGMNEALTRIEEYDRKGDPRAKEGRELLLKFHHIRQMLELAEFKAVVGGPSGQEQDRRFLDALVAARWDAQSFKGGVYVDLYDFCDRLEASSSKVSELEVIKKAIRSEPPSSNDAVLHSLTTGPDFQHARGLSVYFPVMAFDYTPKYMNLQFARDTGWGRLVRAYLEVTRRPRRDEDTLWFGEGHIRRYKSAEIDPLHRDEVEARIIGVDESAGASGAAAAKLGKGGTTDTAKGGTTDTAKGGTTDTAKGKLAAVFGNQPDGFRRIV